MDLVTIPTDKFHKGERVKFSALGLTRNLHKSPKTWTATVVGFGRDGHSVRVIATGTKTPQNFHADFLVVVS